MANAVTRLRADQSYSWAAIAERAGITRQSAYELWATRPVAEAPTGDGEEEGR